MIINSGAYLKIAGSDAHYTNETSGTLHGRIDLDGIVEVEGNWSNNATAGYVFDDYLDSDGKIIFKGLTQQTIGGSGATYFENLELDNANGFSLSSDVEINNALTLTNGVITLNNNNLSIGTSGMISGTFGPAQMIVTNGTGSLRKAFSSTGVFTFPIGDHTSDAEYSPVDINLNSGDLSAAWIGAKVTDAKHPNDNSDDEYLTRYWTLTSSGITNPVYDADFNYLDTDIFGEETDIYGAGFDGASRTLYSKISASTNTISITDHSTFIDYTGVDGTSPMVTISTTETSPTNVSPIPIKLEFTEEVTGIVAGDIDVVNGSPGNLNTADNITYTVDITPTTDGDVVVDFIAGITTDLAGNDNLAATQFIIKYDQASPQIAELYPENNMVGVALSDNLQINFDEIVYLNTGTVEIRKVSDGSLVESIDVTTLSGDGTETVTINPSADFESLVEYYILISAGAFTDEAGNEFDGITTNSEWTFTTVDADSPVISSVSPEDESMDVSVNTNLVITFNENVIAQSGNIEVKKSSDNTVVSSIDVTSGDVSGDGTSTITVDIPVTLDGETTYYVNIDATAFDDNDGNSFAGLTSTTYWNFTTEDIDEPLMLATVPENGAINVLLASNLQITFNEKVVAATGDITIMNATSSETHEIIDVTSAQVTGENTETLTIDPFINLEDQSNYYVLMDAGAIQDEAGNNFAGIGSSSVWSFNTVDLTSPTVNITSSEDDPTYNNPFVVIITFSEEVTGFSAGDITVGNGSVSNLESQDNIEFIAQIAPLSVGSVTIDVNANVASDLSGNGNTAANQFSIEFAGEKPGVTISSTESAYVNTYPIPIDILFTEEVSGFDVSDITITNGSVSNLVTADNISFTADVTPTDEGEITIQISAGLVANSIGNTNTASNLFTIVYDVTSPMVDITSSESTLTNVSPFNITITFNEEVAGFEIADITVGNGAASDLSTTDNLVYNAAVTPASDGEVTVDIDAAVATDLAGNNNDAATQFAITYDGTVPTVSISSTAGDTITDENFDVIVTFSEEITGFDNADLTIANGTLENLTSADNIEFTASIAATDQGDVTVDIAANVVNDIAGNGNTVSEQFKVYYDPSTGFGQIMSYEISVYAVDEFVVVEFLNNHNHQFNNGQIEIYNSIGQKIVSKKINNFAKYRTRVSDAAGIYIVKVIVDGRSLTKKVYIK
ncbi:MAG: Ig-like domain-containing protein [Bacteroidales bacterium]